MFRWTVYAILVALSVAAGFATKAYFFGTPDMEAWKAAGNDDSTRIGGPFTLIDHGGRRVTDEDYRGSILLLFFGYTFCPDACPTTMQNVSDALDVMGPAAAVQPLFISVDPDRDTPDVLAAYVRHFHPKIVALTGSLDQVQAIARAYRVRFNKVVIEGAAPGDYLIDHAAGIYVVDPDGTFFQYFPYETAPEVMARRLSRRLARLKARQSTSGDLTPAISEPGSLR